MILMNSFSYKDDLLKNVISAVPSLDKFPMVEDGRIPGELYFGDGLITLNPGRKAITLKVTNRGDRPIQVLGMYIQFFFFKFCIL